MWARVGSGLGGWTRSVRRIWEFVREDPVSPPPARPGLNFSPFLTRPAALQHTALHRGAHSALFPSRLSSTSPASWPQQGSCLPLCESPSSQLILCFTTSVEIHFNPPFAYQIKGTVLHPLFSHSLARCSRSCSSHIRPTR